MQQDVTSGSQGHLGLSLLSWSEDEVSPGPNCHLKIQTTFQNQAHHQFRGANSSRVLVFGLREEAWVRGENPCVHMENMQTCVQQGPGLDSNQWRVGVRQLGWAPPSIVDQLGVILYSQLSLNSLTTKAKLMHGISSWITMRCCDSLSNTT